MWCSQSRSCLMLSQVCFSVRGAVRCHVSGRSLPPNPKGVTLTVAHTALLTLPVRSCREGPELFGSIHLGFCELASAECVNLSTRVTRGSGHRDPQPRTPRLWGGRTPFAPRSKRESGHQTSRPRTPRFCRSGHRIRPSLLKNHYLTSATNVHHPGRRNLCERLGHEPSSGETADDARGDT